MDFRCTECRTGEGTYDEVFEKENKCVQLEGFDGIVDLTLLCPHSFHGCKFKDIEVK